MTSLQRKTNRKALCGFGTTFDAKHWFTIESSGISGITISLSIHIYALVVLYYFVVLHTNNVSNNTIVTTILSNIVFYLLYVPAALLAIVSLYQAAFTNPGAVPMGAKPFTKVRRILSHASSSTAELLPSSSTLNSANGTTDTGSTTTSTKDDTNTTPPPTTVSTGMMTVTSNANTESIRRCYKCNDNYKPGRAHHDSVSDRCIVKFDHYCPWVNNAIGALNHKFFCLFLFYTAVSCVLSLLLLFIHYIHCLSYHNEDSISSSINANKNTAVHVDTHHSDLIDDPKTRSSIHGHDGIIFDTDGGRRLMSLFRQLPTSSNRNDSTIQLNTADHDECINFFEQYAIIGLLFASFIFFVFTVIMTCEQYDAIITGKGKIARMKQRVGQNGTEFQTVTEEFNEMFGGTSPNVAWHWFLPIPVRFPRGMKQVVLGYEFNDSCNPNAPYLMESTSDESIPLATLTKDSRNNKIETDDLESNTSGRDQDRQLNALHDANNETDGLMKVTSINEKDGLMKVPPSNLKKPPPSSMSIESTPPTNGNNKLNRRTNRATSSDYDTSSGSIAIGEGLTLVERGKPRLT